MALLNRPSRVLPTAPIVETAGRAPGLGLASSVEGLRGVRKREFCASIDCAKTLQMIEDLESMAYAILGSASSLPGRMSEDQKKWQEYALEMLQVAKSLQTVANICCA
jgi:hypothetical protein